MVSFFFIGYFFGMLAFFLPDKIGRRKTMNISLFFALISNGLIVFGPNMDYKKIGFFINGMMHLRIPLSYQHCSEMTPKAYTDRALTVIGFFDSSTTGIACIFLLLQKKGENMQQLLIIYYALGCLGSFLYVFFIYESPRWLLMQYELSVDARKILNKMAGFNGFTHRLSDQANYINSALHSKIGTS